MRLEIRAPEGLGEITPGTDLGALLADLLADDLRDGDIVVVTSKIVSKAEGRLADEADYEQVFADETVEVVAHRPGVRIVRNRLGITQAAAGLDRSNVAGGTVLLLPADPDASARAIHAALTARTGHRLGVVISDTAGRAWREGQTDHAIGSAHVLDIDDHAGRVDAHGNPLAVTAIAVADELAAAADLVKGKLSGRPVAVVRGRPDLVTDEPGGVRGLYRDPSRDLFAHGTREAVLLAVLHAIGRGEEYGSLVLLDHDEVVRRVTEWAPETEAAALARVLTAAGYPAVD
ncbi:coenzyme F420-0:L-glutamate ligase [Enemella sp. A6]|uniref:coenzyme F420-0:L-glutamate ligase n=1 Tax=Enemella sp. A6 TaxID=3440152 RepID=UPI003EBBC559